MTLRAELPPVTERIARLPVHRGYPVPWFVAWLDDGHEMPVGEGEPDFRIVAPDRIGRALREELCWICGGRTGAYRSFVLGPMCTVTRTTAEPPCHRECATWSARACPFLTRPHMARRDAGLPEDAEEMPGIPLKRNPGCVAVWTTKRFSVWDAPGGGRLMTVGTPESVDWWACGRPASRDEVDASIYSGLPLLEVEAAKDGPVAMEHLARQLAGSTFVRPKP